MDAERRANIIEIWKTVVEVQQHFNEIEMKIRGIFVTMVLAIIAAQGFLAEKGLSFEFGRVEILYATFLPLLGIVATYLFYFMDKHWYHRLLVGAVNHGISIEKAHAKEIPELALGASIGEASPVILNGRIAKAIAALVVSKTNFNSKGALRSIGKIEFFYKSVAILFWLLFAATIVFAGVLVDRKALIFALWGWAKSLGSFFARTFQGGI